MSSTIQIVLFVCVVVVLVVDILNIRKNSQLQQQINLCADLHRQLLGTVIEQEDAIINELDELYNQLWDNKLENLISQLSAMYKDKEISFCPYHNQVMTAYTEHQTELASKIKHIKRKQSYMTKRMRSILDPNDNDCDCGKIDD